MFKIKRLTKVGYMFGVGVYRPLSDRIELNARLTYEHKGAKSELDTPLTPESRVINVEDYTYKYMTLSVAPRIYVGKKENTFFLLVHITAKLRALMDMGEPTTHLISMKLKGDIMVDFSNISETMGHPILLHTCQA
jgi:hypothetical protein